MEFFSEELLRDVATFLMRLVEAAGVLVIFAGAVVAFIRVILTAIRSRRSEAFIEVRLKFGRFLALGLEFQLAADLLRTAVAPSFQEIGKLAAVAAIRTALNWYLAREIHDEREQVGASSHSNAAPDSPRA